MTSKTSSATGVKSFSDYTVSEMKKYAKDSNLDIKGLSKKSDILAKIMEFRNTPISHLVNAMASVSLEKPTTIVPEQATVVHEQSQQSGPILSPPLSREEIMFSKQRRWYDGWRRAEFQGSKRKMWVWVVECSTSDEDNQNMGIFQLEKDARNIYSENIARLTNLANGKLGEENTINQKYGCAGMETYFPEVGVVRMAKRGICMQDC